MGKFEIIVKTRLKIMIAFNVFGLILIALAVVFGQIFETINPMTDFIHGFQVGVFTGFEVVAFVIVIKFAQSLKDPKKLEALYISENDERKKFIKDKIGSIGFNFALSGIALGSIIAGFFNAIVFFTLLGVLAFLAFTKAFLKIYYNKKY